MSDEEWRERVKEREKSEEINCKKCVHRIDGDICLEWSRIRGSSYKISTGFSGIRNDAPFCQMYTPKKNFGGPRCR